MKSCRTLWRLADENHELNGLWMELLDIRKMIKSKMIRSLGKALDTGCRHTVLNDILDKV